MLITGKRDPGANKRSILPGASCPEIPVQPGESGYGANKRSTWAVVKCIETTVLNAKAGNRLLRTFRAAGSLLLSEGEECMQTNEQLACDAERLTDVPGILCIFKSDARGVAIPAQCGYKQSHHPK